MASRRRDQAPMTAVRGPKVGDVTCQFYMHSKCKFGSDCKFLHPANVNPERNASSSLMSGQTVENGGVTMTPAEKDAFDLEMVERALPRISTPCKYFLLGTCSRGDLCRYAHVAPDSSATEDCPICLQSIVPPKLFGLLSDCDHVICLDCIRTWRKSDNQNETKYCCPLCRAKSTLVIPSSVFATGSAKNEIRAQYITRLSKMPCKHFNYGSGRCPFAPNCFYAHVNADGELMLDEQGLQSAGSKPIRMPNRGRQSRAGGSRRNVFPRALDLSPSLTRILGTFSDDVEAQALLRLYLRLGLPFSVDLDADADDATLVMDDDVRANLGLYQDSSDEDYD